MNITSLFKALNRASHGKATATYSRKKTSGFTLIEVLIVLGILAILATLVLVAVNPGRQFKMARDTKRSADVATILSAVSQNIADHAGELVCGGDVVALDTDPTEISSEEEGFNLADCIVPAYISGLPFDPAIATAHYTNESHYATGYTISTDSLDRVTISAQGESEGSETISVTR